VAGQAVQGARDINEAFIRGRHKEKGTLVYFIGFNALDIMLGTVR
jgi:hypothetical protein